MSQEEAQVLLRRSRSSNKQLRHDHRHRGGRSLLLIFQEGQDLGGWCVKLQKREQDGMDLSSEFAGWRNDNRSDVVLLGGFAEAEEFLDEGEEERERLATACDGLDTELSAQEVNWECNKVSYLNDNVLVAEEVWYRGCLNGRHLGESHGRDSIKDPFCEGRSECIPSPGTPPLFDFPRHHSC